MFSMFTSPQKLHAKGIMGMNKRNGAYIGRYNDRSKYPLVDDKLKTKIIAQEHGATVPKLIHNPIRTSARTVNLVDNNNWL